MLPEIPPELGDALAADDSASVIVPPPKALAVLLVTERNFFLEHVLNTLKEDQYFGELGLLRAEPRNATVRAKTSLEVIRVSADAFRMMVESSKQTAEDIARVAQSRVRTEVGSPR